MAESATTRDFVAIVSLSALGLLAGMMLGIVIAGYAARGLPEESWTRRFQLEEPLVHEDDAPIPNAAAALEVAIESHARAIGGSAGAPVLLGGGRARLGTRKRPPDRTVRDARPPRRMISDSSYPVTTALADGFEGTRRRLSPSAFASAASTTLAGRSLGRVQFLKRCGMTA